MARMKLYLSSHGIPDPDEFARFVGKPAREIRFGLVFNAKDHKAPAERAARRDEVAAYFGNLGFDVREIDLRDHFEDNSGLLPELWHCDVVWLNGGNTYMLRWAIAESRAEQPILDALASGVVYAGNSAGAIVAGPTLKHFDNADDPSAAPDPIYKGLGLIDRVVLPHWGSEDYGEAVRGTKAMLEGEGYRTIALTNEDALLVEVET